MCEHVYVHMLSVELICAYVPMKDEGLQLLTKKYTQTEYEIKKMLIAALFNSLNQRIGINSISIKIEYENLVCVYIQK